MGTATGTAREVAAQQQETRPPGRPPLYDWDELLDGTKWLLVRGEDYTCSSHSFAQMFRRKARARGLTPHVSFPPGQYPETAVALKAWVDERDDD